MDISPEELKFLKSLNQKVKGIGGEVTIEWNIAHKIEKWSIKSESNGESVYNSNPSGGSRESELRD